MKKLLFIFNLLLVSSMHAVTFVSGGINYEGTDSAPYTASVTLNTNYIGTATIPATVVNQGISYSVTSIEDYAFQFGTDLTSVSIPNSVTSIGDFAFQNCVGLIAASIPNSVTSIGQYAFYFCVGLTSVNIPNSLISIETFTFGYCSQLKAVSIPNSVTSIGYGAFHSCSGLTSISIPNSVTSIGQYAFYSCTGLTSISVNISTPITIDTSVFSAVAIYNIPLTVPTGASAAYNTAAYWSYFSPITESSTLSTNTFEDSFTASIYPNPVKDILTIQSDKEIKLVELFNLQGQKVKSSNQKQISVSGLTRGIYLIKIKNANNAISTQKIIKN